MIVVNNFKREHKKSSHVILQIRGKKACFLFFWNSRLSKYLFNYYCNFIEQDFRNVFTISLVISSIPFDFMLFSLFKSSKISSLFDLKENYHVVTCYVTNQFFPFYIVL